MNMLRRPRTSGPAPEVAAILEEERALSGVTIPPRRTAELQVRKWEAVRTFFEAHPFEVSEALARAEQWRRVARHLREILDEPEVVAYALVQAEIADHIAQGIQDLRPRGDGPCHGVLMRWIKGREYKARAVLAWIKAAEESCQIPS